MDLSICIPGIRPDRWGLVCDTAENSCFRYEFEIIFVGPYAPSQEVLGRKYVTFIEDWGCPTRATQIAVKHATAPLIARIDDDAKFFEDGLNQAVDLKKTLGEKDCVVLRYREGVNYGGAPVHKNYWHANHHKVVRRFGFPAHYMVSMTPLFTKDYLVRIGGWDCRFEHLNWATHDICYRIQRDGGVFHESPIEVTTNDWFPGRKGDHGPIIDAQDHHDWPLFVGIMAKKNVRKRIMIDFDNWKQAEERWVRRFGK